jgi:hypothetical protein
MTDSIIPFKRREPSDEWLLSFDLVRRPDDKLVLRLMAISRAETETNEAVRARAERILGMLRDALIATEIEIAKIGDA